MDCTESGISLIDRFCIARPSLRVAEPDWSVNIACPTQTTPGGLEREGFVWLFHAHRASASGRAGDARSRFVTGCFGSAKDKRRPEVAVTGSEPPPGPVGRGWLGGDRRVPLSRVYSIRVTRF